MKAQEKEKKSAWYKSYVFYGIIAVFVTLLACVTFAFFVDDGTDTGVVSFGVIELDKEDSVFRGASVDNVLPGGPMVDAISFKQTDRSRPYYARAKVEFSIPESSLYKFTGIVDTLNATIANLTYTGNGYTWEKSDDGYFYLVKIGGGSVMHKISDTTPIIFTEGVKCPTTEEQVFSSNDTENNIILQVGSKIEVVFTVEVIQAENHASGSVSTITQIKQAFPAVTKSFSFAYMQGVDAPAVSMTSLNVGDELPVVTKANYKIVWFNNPDAVYEPFVAETARIRPGVKYYGMWFYTGNSGYTANVNGLTSYTGSEQNIILPRVVSSYSNITNLVSLGNSTAVRVIIPEGYTTITTSAFANAPLLNVLMMPSTLVTIGSRLFGSADSSYSNVQYLTVPANVQTIGEYAFNAPSLCQVTFLGVKVNVENLLLTDELNSFFEIIVPNIAHYKTGTWTNYKIVSGSSYRRIYDDGVFYSKKSTDSSYTAYAANRNLADVVIKSTIKVDNEYVNVTVVDNHFNSYNNNLRTLDVGEGVTTVKSMCKSDKYLTKVTFGYMVTRIEAYALDKMTALTTLVFLGRVANYNSNAITSSCTAISRIYVPSGHKTYYSNVFASSAISTSYTVVGGTPTD